MPITYPKDPALEAVFKQVVEAPESKEFHAQISSRIKNLVSSRRKTAKKPSRRNKK